MKKVIFIVLAILSAISCLNSQGQGKPTKLFKHIVTVTFDNSASQKDIDEVDSSFKGLSKLIFVKGFEWGIAPITDRNKEIKHTYAFSFSSLEDLDRYAKSPQHQKHIKVGVSITKKVEAVQYFVEE